MSADGFERVAVETGRRSGATLVVAIHSTYLGPALGGARMWHYGDPAEAIDDAKRLGAAMTLKAAAAGLDLGGGKGVIATPGPGPPGDALRRALLLDFGDLVESLGGRYVTAEDVGTGAEDMAVIAERTSHVVGLDRSRGGSGDPSPITALGVSAAIRACVEHRYGTSELGGISACVVGLGHVGTRLATLLAGAGAELLLSDIDPRRRALAEELGARWVEPRRALLEPCEILAPCALGGAIDESAAAAMRAGIVCGAANNVLSEEGVAEVLLQRGILYAPDFIANAGGLISVYGELRGLSPERASRLAREIGATLTSILNLAERRSTTPLVAARALAERRLGPADPAASSADLVGGRKAGLQLST